MPNSATIADCSRITATSKVELQEAFQKILYQLPPLVFEAVALDRSKRNMDYSAFRGSYIHSCWDTGNMCMGLRELEKTADTLCSAKYMDMSLLK